MTTVHCYQSEYLWKEVSIVSQTMFRIGKPADQIKEDKNR